MAQREAMDVEWDKEGGHVTVDQSRLTLGALLAAMEHELAGSSYREL